MASDDALADELRSLARTLHETVADDERRAAALDLLRKLHRRCHHPSGATNLSLRFGTEDCVHVHCSGV